MIRLLVLLLAACAVDPAPVTVPPGTYSPEFEQVKKDVEAILTGMQRAQQRVNASGDVAPAE